MKVELFTWKIKIDGKEYGSTLKIGVSTKVFLSTFTNFLEILGKQISHSVAMIYHNEVEKEITKVYGKK